mmetsp:Transcript_113615/g.157155  ORF Transcript_113615/g.157155 Transcript_113615/m.157155 type:complete len:541 (+) Transcript_113615:2084-3706(+)
MITTPANIVAGHLMALPADHIKFFCRDFGNAFSRDYIGDADLTTCMLGLDVGGYLEQDPNTDRAVFGGIPMFQFYNADGSIRTAARQQLNDHIKRKRILFSYLMEHISNSNINIREMLTSQAPHDGAKAYRILYQQCHQDVDDLTLMEHDVEWDSVSLLTIGINEHSITNLIAHLHSLNAKRPSNKQKTNDQLVIKVLSCITSDISESLAHKCQEEIAAPPSQRKYWTDNERDAIKLKADLQPLWKIKFNQGAISTPKEGGRRATGGGVRPDASYLKDTALVAKPDSPAHGHQPQRAVLTSGQALKAARCYRCQGSGHQANVCPTPADHSVTIHDWIAALQSHTAARAKGSRGKGKGSHSQPAKQGRGRSNSAYILSDVTEADNSANTTANANAPSDAVHFAAGDEWRDIVDDTAFAVRIEKLYPPGVEPSTFCLWSCLRYIWAVFRHLFFGPQTARRCMANSDTALLSHSPTARQLSFIVDCGATKHCIADETELGYLVKACLASCRACCFLLGSGSFLGLADFRCCPGLFFVGSAWPG